jgi:Mrp family chromosome partitioning ATPase
MQRELDGEIALLRSREAILARELAELQQRSRALAAAEAEGERLEREVRARAGELTLLRDKHRPALAEESPGIDEVTVVAPAVAPRVPVLPRRLALLLAGGVVGLAFGVVLALVRDARATSVGKIRGVESALRAPVLGVVPRLDRQASIARIGERRPELAEDREALTARARLLTHFDPRSPGAEAYRALRTAVNAALAARAGKVLVVTSAVADEGRRAVVANLALATAQNGQRTLLVAADLRQPTLHRLLGLVDGPGLAEILAGRVQWQACVRSIPDMVTGSLDVDDVLVSPGLDNLHVIAAGALPTNPAELLAGASMAALLAGVREEYDVVLIEAPPVLAVADAAILAARAQGVVLVHRPVAVQRRLLERAKTRLETAHATVWGVVLTDVAPETAASLSEARDDGEETGVRGWWPLRRRRGGRASLRRGIAWGGVLVGAVTAVLLAAEPWRRVDVRRVAARTTAPSVRAPGPDHLPGAAREATETPAPEGAGRFLADTTWAGSVRPGLQVATDPAPAPDGRGSARFALELGPFPTAEEAHAAEQRLNEAGYPTIWIREDSGGSPHAVIVEGVASVAETDALAAALRAEGLGEPVAEGGARRSVRVADRLVLRRAVQLAQRLRGHGLEVRLATQPGVAVAFVVRHGSFVAREEAEARRVELTRLGLTAALVQVR